MEFDWDSAKYANNLEKHGVAFERVRDFDFETTLEITYKRKGETRTTAYGLIDDRVYCLVYAMRGATMRIISLRKANRREVLRYVSKP